MKTKSGLSKSLLLSLALGTALSIPMVGHAETVGTVSGDVSADSNTGYALFDNGTHSVTATTGDNTFATQANGVAAVEVVGGATGTVTATAGNNILTADTALQEQPEAQSSDGVGVVHAHSTATGSAAAQPATVTITAGKANQVTANVNLGTNGAAVLASKGGNITMTAKEATTITATQNSAIIVNGLQSAEQGKTILTINNGKSIQMTGTGNESGNGVVNALGASELTLGASEGVTVTATGTATSAIRSASATVTVDAGTFKTESGSNKAGIAAQGGGTIAVTTKTEEAESVSVAGGISTAGAGNNVTVTSAGGIKLNGPAAITAADTSSATIKLTAQKGDIAAAGTVNTAAGNVTVSSNEGGVTLGDVTTKGTTLKVSGTTNVNAGNLTANGSSNVTVTNTGEAGETTTTIGNVSMGIQDESPETASLIIGGADGKGTYTVGKVLTSNANVTLGSDSAKNVTVEKVHTYGTVDNTTSIKGKVLELGLVMAGKNPTRADGTTVEISSSNYSSIKGIVNFGKSLNITNVQGLSISGITSSAINPDEDGSIPSSYLDKNAILAGAGSKATINGGNAFTIEGSGVRSVGGEVNLITSSVLMVEGELFAERKGTINVNKDVHEAVMTTVAGLKAKTDGDINLFGVVTNTADTTADGGSIAFNQGASLGGDTTVSNAGSVTVNKGNLEFTKGKTVSVTGENSKFTGEGLTGITGGANLTTLDKGIIDLKSTGTSDALGALTSTDEASAINTSSTGALTIESATASGSGAINVNKDSEAGAITVNQTVTSNTGGTVVIGNAATETMTVTGGMSGTGAIIVDGKAVNASDVDAQKAGTITLGNAGTAATTVTGTVKTESGTVNVHGVSITTGESVTATGDGAETNGTGTINIGDDSTTTLKLGASDNGTLAATANGIINAKGKDVKGKDVSATGANSAVNIISQTGGEGIALTGAVKADAGTVNMNATGDGATSPVNINVGDAVTAVNAGTVNIGNGTTAQANITGEISATGKDSAVVVNGDNVKAANNVLATAEGSVTLGNDKTNATLEGTVTGDAGTVEVKGTTIRAKKEVAATNAGTVTIGSQETNTATLDGDVSSKNGATVSVGNVNAETVTVGNLTTEAVADKVGGTINVTGKQVTTKESIVSNNGGSITVTGDALTLGDAQQATTVTATGTAQGADGTKKASTVKLEQKAGDLNLSEQKVSLNASAGGEIMVNGMAGTLTTREKAVTATGTGSKVELNGKGVTTNGLDANQGGVITVNGRDSGDQNATTAPITLGGETTADGAGSQIVATGNPVEAADVNAKAGGTVVINGQTTLGDNAAAAPVSVTGTVTADGAGSNVSISGSTVSTKTLTATNDGTISVTGTESASVETMNQNGGTVSLNAPAVKVGNYEADNAAINVGAGNTVHIGTLTGEGNTFFITPDMDPAKSTYLILDKGVDKTQQVAWTMPSREAMDTLEQTLQGNDGKPGVVSRIPFASVLTEGKAPLFEVGSTPQVKLSNGLEDANLVLGEEKAANATAQDKTFMDAANNRLTDKADLTKGNFYYVYLQAPRASGDAIHAINGSTIGALVLGTDMIPSARDYGVNRDSDIHAFYTNTGYRGMGSKLHNHNLNVGYDTFKDVGSNRHNVSASVIYDQGTGSLGYTASDIKAKQYGVRLEDRVHFNNGGYANYAVEVGKVHNTFHFTMNDSVKDGKYHQGYQKVSAEYGLHQEHAKGFYTTPQVQLQYAHVGSASMSPAENTTLRLGAVNSVQGRLGMVVGRHLDVGDHTYNMYLAANLFHEFGGKQDIGLLGHGDTTWNRSIGRTWYDFGAGVNAFLGKGTEAYVAMNKTFGREYGKNYEVKAGVKLSF